MRLSLRKTLPIAALVFVFAALPLSPRTVQACPSMSGGSASMDQASACACGSGCNCGMSQSGETELALLPATMAPSGPSSEMSQTPLFEAAGVSSQMTRPAMPDTSPPESSGKEKIYDLQSDYRI